MIITLFLFHRRINIVISTDAGEHVILSEVKTHKYLVCKIITRGIGMRYARLDRFWLGIGFRCGFTFFVKYYRNVYAIGAKGPRKFEIFRFEIGNLGPLFYSFLMSALLMSVYFTALSSFILKKIIQSSHFFFYFTEFHFIFWN